MMRVKTLSIKKAPSKGFFQVAENERLTSLNSFGEGSKSKDLSLRSSFFVCNHFSNEFENVYKQKIPLMWDLCSLAENERFELSVPCGTLVFKTSAFDHSANSPLQKYKYI